MPYCNLNDLFKRFSESEINDLLDTNDDGVHDTQKLDMTIADADGLIDGFLGVRYRVPLSPINSPKSYGVVRLFSCDITRYLLWDDNAPQEIKDRYDAAIARLKDYAKGLMVLPDVEAAPQNPSGGVDFVANERIFSQETLRGF